MRFRMMFCVVAGLGSVSGAALCLDKADLPAVEEQAIAEDNSLKALRQIQTYMEDVTSLKADFRQHAPGGNLATGTLYLERPGHIRFDYSDDTPFLIVADGKSLNFIDYEIGQVTKWPVKDTPLRALLGGALDLASLGARIDIEPAGAKGVVALAARDGDHPELGEITLYFRQQDGFDAGLTLLSWSVVDAQDQMTYVELSDTETNVVLDDTLWTFEDPRGLTKRRRVR